MKTAVVIVLMFFSAVIFASEIINSKSIDIGSGLREVKTAEKLNNSSEKITNHRYLYHKDRKLSQISYFSISPSGTYIVYVSLPDGIIHLYSTDEKLDTKLTNKFIAPIKKITWNETFEIVTINFSGKNPPQNFALE